MSPDVFLFCTGSTRLRSYAMTHRSQTSLTSLMATLDFSQFWSNDRPPTKLSAFLTVGQRQKKTLAITFHPQHHLAKQIATPATCGLPLKATQNHMCESPTPSDTQTYTHRQPGVTAVGRLGGSQNQRYKSWKLKDLQTGHLFLSLRQECFSLDDRLNVNQQPTDADWCGRSPFIGSFEKRKKKKKRAQTLNVFSMSEWVQIWM